MIMIAQMSQNSKVYHMDKCKYLRMIKEEDLTVFDMNDMDLELLKPCKCCCNLKSMYKQNEKHFKRMFADFNVEMEFDEDCIRINTPTYKWQINIESSTQLIRAFVESWDEKTVQYLWIRNERCRDTRNLVKVMQFIANEEKLAPYPAPFRKYVFKIDNFLKKNNVQIEYNENELYVITDIAAWKIKYDTHQEWYKLFHCPFNDKALTMDEAKTAYYHFQYDVLFHQSPLKHLKYIVKHDRAKKIEEVDYKKLPRKTKKQKRYYRQAKNRAKRRSIARVLNLIDNLENMGNQSRITQA